MLTDQELANLNNKIKQLTPSQQTVVVNTVNAYLDQGTLFRRNPNSDLISDQVLIQIGDRLIAHHAASRQNLSKDRFEYAFEYALKSAGINAYLETNPTNRGHDITINGVPVSLKTQADKSIKEGYIHISKMMELGGGAWELPRLRDLFIEHLQGYQRIFTFRCLSKDPKHLKYELVEIPHSLMMEAQTNCQFESMVNSTQNPQPGYGRVFDPHGNLKYELYFDGGGERKLQIKKLRKDLCFVHATWEFGSALAP